MTARWRVKLKFRARSVAIKKGAVTVNFNNPSKKQTHNFVSGHCLLNTDICNCVILVRYAPKGKRTLRKETKQEVVWHAMNEEYGQPQPVTLFCKGAEKKQTKT